MMAKADMITFRCIASGEETRVTATRSFTLIAIVLLAWNLMGVAAFVLQFTADLDTLARTDPYTAQIFARMPGWAWIAYAVAVGAGTVGAVLLLLRKAAATWLFLASLVAVLAQFGHSFLGTDMLAVKGPTTLIFPAVIVLIAVAQWLYARSLTAKGALR